MLALFRLFPRCLFTIGRRFDSRFSRDNLELRTLRTLGPVAWWWEDKASTLWPTTTTFYSQLIVPSFRSLSCPLFFRSKCFQNGSVDSVFFFNQEPPFRSVEPVVCGFWCWKTSTVVAVVGLRQLVGRWKPFRRDRKIKSTNHFSSSGDLRGTVTRHETCSATSHATNRTEIFERMPLISSAFRSR